MKTIKTVAASLAFLLATPACAQTPARAVIPAHPALWVVKDADTTIYLFGTVHALRPDIAWFDPAVKKAFEASAQLVLEIPLPTPEEAQAVLLPLVIDPTGPTLTEKLPAASRPAFAAALTRLGVPPGALNRVEPWFAAVTMGQILLRNAGFSPADGAEVTLDAKARAAGKPVTGLETLAQQLGYFHDLPEKDQVAFLLENVTDIDTFDATITAMVDKWKAGDADGLSALMNEDLTGQPTLYKTLLVDRNARWADWIDTRLKTPGTVFVAVGAGHLAGRDSVQAQLAKHRLVATRIQ